MKRLVRRPRWWVLSVFLAGFLGLMALEHIRPERPEGHEIIFIGGVVALHIGLFFWVGANARAIQDEKDLRHDADIHKLKMPTTDEQAAYRLAKIRYHEELEKRNGSDDKAI